MQQSAESNLYQEVQELSLRLKAQRAHPYRPTRQRPGSVRRRPKNKSPAWNSRPRKIETEEGIHETMRAWGPERGMAFCLSGEAIKRHIEYYQGRATKLVCVEADPQIYARMLQNMISIPGNLPVSAEMGEFWETVKNSREKASFIDFDGMKPYSGSLERKIIEASENFAPNAVLRLTLSQADPPANQAGLMLGGKLPRHKATKTHIEKRSSTGHGCYMLHVVMKLEPKETENGKKEPQDGREDKTGDTL